MTTIDAGAITLRTADRVARRAKHARADHRRTSGGPPAAAHARRVDRRTPTRFLVAVDGRHDGRLRASSRRSARRSPKCGRSRSTRRARGQRRRCRARRRAPAPRPSRRLRQAVRVHARARRTSSDGLLDRAAPLAAGEDLHRLREVPAVPHCGQYAMVLPLEVGSVDSSAADRAAALASRAQRIRRHDVRVQTRRSPSPAASRRRGVPRGGRQRRASRRSGASIWR